MLGHLTYAITGRSLINQAINVFSGRPKYRNELARAMYKAGQISKREGNEGSAAEFDEAFKLRRLVRPHDGRDCSELVEADFDDLVVFWSR